MSAQTIVTFVRHPATPKKEEKQGPNTKFGKNGKKDAFLIASYFLQDPPDHIMSSEYLRAQEAAFILRNRLRHQGSAKKPDVTISPLFNEISRPLVDGKPFSELDDYFQWRNNIIHHPTRQNIRSRFKNTGESYWDLFDMRIGLILELFSEPQYSGGKIAVFTHSQLIAMVKTRIELGQSPSPEKLMLTFNRNFPDYSSINTFSFTKEGGWTDVDYNYTKHLK